ncbi:hypothetical protein CSUI_000200, partial [Cystoisospora suis]
MQRCLSLDFGIEAGPTFPSFFLFIFLSIDFFLSMFMTYKARTDVFAFLRFLAWVRTHSIFKEFLLLISFVLSFSPKIPLAVVYVAQSKIERIVAVLRGSVYLSLFNLSFYLPLSSFQSP